ncbi:MAG: LysR family transcriptional regulator, partial [Erysipelotrichaceae bacterium]
MNDKQLECFIDLTETLSFSKTARNLYTTQPNVTHHIKTLEKELNIKLIERDTKTVTLTKAGEEFLKYAENIKKEIDKALIAMNNINSNNEITIGFPSTLLLYNM